jgi:hypothetical protein
MKILFSFYFIVNIYNRIIVAKKVIIIKYNKKQVCLHLNMKTATMMMLLIDFLNLY